MSNLPTCQAKAREIIEILGLTTENSVEIRSRAKGRTRRQRFYSFTAFENDELDQKFDHLVLALSFEECINIWRTNSQFEEGYLFGFEVNHLDPEAAATSMANLALRDQIALMLEPVDAPEPEFVTV